MHKYGQCLSRNPKIRALYKEQPLYDPQKKKTGKVKPRKHQVRAVIVDGVRYPSIKAAAIENGITEYALSKALKANRKCKGHTIAYDTKNPLGGHNKAISVTVDLKHEFPSANAAAEFMLCSPSSLTNALRKAKEQGYPYKCCGHTVIRTKDLKKECECVG